MQNIYDIVFLNEKSSPKVKHESLKFTNSYGDFLNPKYGRMTCERIEKLLESIRFNLFIAHGCILQVSFPVDLLLPY